MTPWNPANPFDDVDFRVNGLNADTGVAQDFFNRIVVNSLTSLAEHHTGDDRSFYVLHDEGAAHDIPGTPQYVALYLERDQAAKTFRFDSLVLPLTAMAQSWLIHRGCPPDMLGLDPEQGPKPADQATCALERRLVGDGDHFACGYSYTNDMPEDTVTVAVLREIPTRTPSPFRVVVEEVAPDGATYTLREGGFATLAEAVRWCADRITGDSRPLPPVKPGTSPPPPIPQIRRAVTGGKGCAP